MAEPIITLLENWDETHTLTRDEAIAILELPDEQLPQLIETAYVLRTKYKGKKVSIQLLTNVRSGNCSQRMLLETANTDCLCDRVCGTVFHGTVSVLL